MSTIDEKKEQKEYQCLLDAYDYCINNPVPQQTKEILKYLNGEHLIRDKNDSPDIINICSRNNNQKTLVGIEHFNVSSISKTTTSGRIISLNQLHKSNLSKITDEMIEQVCENGSISQELIEKNYKEVGELAEDALNGTYETYIDSFTSAWNKHASKVENYIKKTMAIADEKSISKVEIAYLIEIDSEFYDWFYNHSNGQVEFVNNGLMPVFKKIISIINSTDNLKKINYIVFFNKTVNKSRQSVIAFRTGSIKSNLEKQGIPIYDFLGESGCKIVIDNIEQDGEELIHTYHFKEYTDDYIKNTVFPLYRKAISLREKHIPFVASRSIQHLLYVNPDNCSNRSIIRRKSKQFSKMYSKGNEE